MKPRYSFSSRRTGQARDPKNVKKQKAKFPEVLKNVLKESDILIEVLDARFVEDTRNKELEKIVKDFGKKIIFAVNKSDLKKNVLLEEGVVVSCKERKGIKKLRDKIKEVSKSVDKSGEKVVVGVVGYPNTGKSSLINLLVGKKSAGFSSQAGFTKGVQKLKLDKNILLIDTPGVIPKKEYTTFESGKISQHVKIGARSYNQIKDSENVVSNLMNEFPGVFEKFYKINAKGDSEILIDALGRKKNFLKRGGKIDSDKAAKLILRDWQEGKIKIG